MAMPTVILHGWSDCSRSFRGLKKFLVEQGVGEVKSIYYADYESREDNLSFDDVVGGLNDEFLRRGLIDGDGCRVGAGFHVVVHSTGGPVIRAWIARYYADRPGECPIRNLVMLAPANFGSPLAHRGKSFLGQLFKGRWKIGDLLEVGRKLLTGLELASPFQWDLAHRDLLRVEPFYRADRVRLTILVGLDDYTGMRGWVNKPGTDGTVVIAGTPLNSVKLRLDFTSRDSPFEWYRSYAVGEFAFGALRGFDHGTIVSAFSKRRHAPDAAPLVHLLRALKVRSAAGFERHRKAVAGVTAAAYDPVNYGDDGAAPRKYQQLIVHAIDDQGAPIYDFTLEFFVRAARRSSDGRVLTSRASTALERRLSEKAQKLLCGEFHRHSQDPSYRRLLVDGARVRELIPPDHLLAMRMYVPRVDGGIYYDTRKIQDVVIFDPSSKAQFEFFFPNTTTLIELVVDRVTSYVTLRTRPRKH